MAKTLELTNVSRPALIRAAQAAVAGALAGEFPEDPIIGGDVSRAISCIGSVIKRHGLLLEMGLAAALKASDRFIVLTGVSLPLTKGAKQLLAARNPDESLARIKLSADSEADGIVKADLVVVDPDAGWAGAYDVKRGNGATEHRKRRPIMQNLRAARLVLASYVEQHGYGPITDTTSAVIDYYGASGFDPKFTLTREEIDGHFGVPVVATVDALTDALREALHAELPRLFEPVFDRLTGPEPRQPARPANSRQRSGVTGADALDAMTAPPIGPTRVSGRPVPARERPRQAARTNH